ncbi:MAG: endonuclease/exonuclease/phosphatase family protein [Deltaproteobacteria bacterium]|nr:endonuclease/exonuclease/phosphatase family protein [Deltaproteobacteria bacterium]
MIPRSTTAGILACSLIAFGLACGNGGSPSDAGLDAWDASDGHRDGDRDESPLRIGRDETFEIATWNIRNFPSDQTSAYRVAGLIDDMDLDVVAVQEIASTAAFDALMAALPGYYAVLSEHEYRPGEYQKTGFIYRAHEIHVRGEKLLFVENDYAFPRPPLEAEFDVSLPGGASVSFVAIVIHLKAYADEDAEARRRAACEALETYLSGLVAGGQQVILLGDFNDQLDDPPGDNVFSAFTGEPSEYNFLTQTLSDQGEYSYIPYRSLIDHILITNGLEDDYSGGSTQAVDLEREPLGYDYEESISDHRPVVAVFPLQGS